MTMVLIAHGVVVVVMGPSMVLVRTWILSVLV